MSKTIQNSIQELADELKMFNRNDVLVNFSDQEKVFPGEGQTHLVLPAEGSLLKTIKKARLHFRESGTSVFCVSNGILNWEWKGIACSSPIVLFPCSFKEDRVKKEFDLKWEVSEGFINPFLQFYFEKEYGFSWKDFYFEHLNWDLINEVLMSKGFNVDVQDDWHCGNFHHHRFSVLRELDTLAKEPHFSSALTSIYNEKTADNSQRTIRSESILFPADNDQRAVFELMKTKNLVVHGPPGTGKSQVLANILGKNLIDNQSTLVVSEKRVALEVLEQKLKTTGLHRFVFLQDDKNGAQHLLKQLKASWKFLESYESKRSNDLYLSKFKLDALQFKLNVLLDEERIGGVSFMQFQQLTKNILLEAIPFSSNAPNISSFLKNREAIADMFDKKLNLLCQIIPKAILDTDEIFQLDSKISALEHRWLALQKICAFDSPKGLHDVLNKAIFAQILDNEAHKDYFKILLPSSSEGKKFTRLSKRYFVLKKEISNLEEGEDVWKERPSLQETKELLTALPNLNFFSRRKFNKRLAELMKSPFLDPTKALEGNLHFQKKSSDFREIQKKLTEIGVHTETEIHWVKSLLPKISPAKWEDWQANDEQKNKELAAANEELNSFYQQLRTYLKLDEDQAISTAFNLFSNHFSSFVEHRQFISSLTKDLYRFIGKFDSIDDLEQSILKSNWVHFVEQFPAFTDFELNQIFKDLDEIITLEKKETVQFSEEIFALKKKQFDELNTFLQIPARKLSEDEKARKVRLRKGRSILIKEFGKTRSHPTIRELLESDAGEWIRTLIPIWMANPSQVGDYFPLQSELFDAVLFDEATQIPLRNSLGALYRGKKAVVLGDEHQMSPSNYFKVGDSEPIDLLHQASFNWPQVMLKHHYRSQYPELIAFSNRNFYGNALIAYPNAFVIENAIQIHTVMSGVYLDQQNIMEAQALVKALTKQLPKSQKSIGVVAFSEKQLHCIYRQLSPADQLLLDERIENNTAFFRSLENVQGDECDHLFISLGYGKNEKGILSFNFGPLNRKSGPRRLNVLLSRAKQKIDFFSSIEASDLSLSDNDALNLLRQFLQVNATNQPQKELTFPFNLNALSFTKKNNKTLVEFSNLIESISDANELLTLYRVLSARGWDITF